MNKNDEIDERVLRALVEAGAVRTVAITGSAIGWRVTVNGKVLMTQRGKGRIFKKLETACALLRDMGIGGAQVDWVHWTPEQKSLA